MKLTKLNAICKYFVAVSQQTFLSALSQVLLCVVFLFSQKMVQREYRKCTYERIAFRRRNPETMTDEPRLCLLLQNLVLSVFWSSFG